MQEMETLLVGARTETDGLPQRSCVELAGRWRGRLGAEKERLLQQLRAAIASPESRAAAAGLGEGTL